MALFLTVPSLRKVASVRRKLYKSIATDWISRITILPGIIMAWINRIMACISRIMAGISRIMDWNKVNHFTEC